MPIALTLADITSRPRQEVTFTVECSGNTGLPFFNGGIGNARWAGTPLAPILEEAGVLDSGIEVVFWGADEGEVKKADDVKFKQNFARSMSLAEAMDPKNILCYEMNGTPLPPDNGFPLRLIAPGWYGIANAKWLKRIEVRDQRFENLFMGRFTLRFARKITTARLWVEPPSDGRGQICAGCYSHRQRLPIVGAAGARRSTGSVKIDGPDVSDPRRSHKAEFAWQMWSIEWPHPAVGAHCHLTRDRYERQRSAGDDRSVDRQKTHLLGKQRTGHRIHIA